MESAVDRGLPFEIDDLWRASSFAPHPDANSLFGTPDFELQPLATESHGEELIAADALTIPPLEDSEGAEDHHLEDLGPPGDDDRNSGRTEGTISPHDVDVWQLDLNHVNTSEGILLRTWETFEKKKVSNTTQTAYLSEAGPGAFDAAIVLSEARSTEGVLPQDTSLRALCNLALGRSSVFFRWNDAKRCFDQTLQGIPTAGLSTPISEQFTTELMEYGALYRRLQDYSAAVGSFRRCSPTVTSFKRSVTSILEAIEAALSAKMPHICSLLQLQAALQTPIELLSFLDIMERSMEDGQSDEEAIGALSDKVTAIAETGNTLSGVLRALLARVCGPWMQRMAVDVGLAEPSPLEVEQAPDDSLIDDLDIDISAAPADREGFDNNVLLRAEDRRLVQETRRALRILRKYCPDKISTTPPFGHTQTASSVLRPNLDFTQGHDACGSDAMHDQAYANGKVSTAVTGRELDGGQDVWGSGENQEHLLEDLHLDTCREPDMMSMALVDDVYTEAAKTLQSDRGDSSATATALHPPATPLNHLISAIGAQSRHLNAILLKHLFRDCNLRQHFDLQHAFHFFGNSDFLMRLSTALFSADTQSAERKRDTIPTSEVLGLRLGAAQEGQRWPPASSELRLTLMGVLSDSYFHGSSNPDTVGFGGQTDLPGGLSFAIRELGDADIDRVMDVHSIYALDFLRLQYAAPAPLDAILTPLAMRRYDEVFRFLLRMVRVTDLTIRLRSSVTGRQKSSDTQNYSVVRFAGLAHHTMTALMSYSMDFGVAAPWTTFQKTLDEVEKSAAIASSRDDAEAGQQNAVTPLIGLDGLRELHMTCLDDIRARLFLRRKEENIRVAIEDILSAILKAAARLQGPTTGSDDDPRAVRSTVLQDCDKAVSRLMGLLRSRVDRPAKSVQSAGSDTDAMAKLLLVKLDWNGWYESRDDAR